MPDETIKRIYNNFEDTHQDTTSKTGLDTPAYISPRKLEIAPADRKTLEEEYGRLTDLVDSYQMKVEHVNDVENKYNNQAVAASKDLPDDMMAQDRSTPRITYEKDGWEETMSCRLFFRQLEENLCGQDERMLADYIVQEFDDGEAMVASWEDTVNDWNAQLYAAAEEHDLTDTLYTVQTALGQYKQEGNQLRRELEAEFESDDEQGLIDKLKGLNPFTGGELYY